MKKLSVLFITFGILLIVLQLLSYIGNARIGNELKFFSNITSFGLFVGELLYFLSYNLIGIIGLCWVVAPWLCKKWDQRVAKQTQEKVSKAEASAKEAIIEIPETRCITEKEREALLEYKETYSQILSQQAELESLERYMDSKPTNQFHLHEIIESENRIKELKQGLQHNNSELKRLKNHSALKNVLDRIEKEKQFKQAEEKYKWIRICALVISLLLSIVTLIGLMAQFTTTEEVTTYEKQTVIETINTYRCYVTATSVCYHSRTCQYIRNDDVESYETTVYEAEKEGLRPCSKCRMGASQKTEIEVEKVVSVPKTEEQTKTNYFAAIIISVIFAVLLYNFIVFKSRREYKNFK